MKLPARGNTDGLFFDIALSQIAMFELFELFECLSPMVIAQLLQSSCQT